MKTERPRTLRFKVLVGRSVASRNEGQRLSKAEDNLGTGWNNRSLRMLQQNIRRDHSSAYNRADEQARRSAKLTANECSGAHSNAIFN